MSLSKAIGIISYLPDNKELSAIRLEKLKKLIVDCKEIFVNIPIIVVAQCWPEDLYKDEENMTIYRFDKPLTIVGARIKLREIFLETNYDYLIMLDDDCELEGTAEAGQNYLKCLDENPDCWMSRHGLLLKLFAISKTIFSQIEYDDVSLERGEGYEDTIFVKKISTFFKDFQRHFPSNIGVSDHSHSSADIHSTWYKPETNLSALSHKTNTYLYKYVLKIPEQTGVPAWINRRSDIPDDLKERLKNIVPFDHTKANKKEFKIEPDEDTSK